ncbi:hypothetical protein PGT21_021446 [Puccinia graminis f. sp. tritici]|uniref:Uncharacterized protein n=1 Tax=Puccinia graminis f. sp. tritici TaxID=56615 RepID=A0A5B0LT15_PUCGR|nr:hypothetical protein PGTUg99_022248 [Puccinia graminis f. sp. tritici]KAA1067000.1 hypothetical protein PGTUg99_024060 [Puccinia graminis f. sp. tritici]KAA1083881.1 hypothetical protein PGT21_010404 [Puccinia graminis f. sp. tritici]KAA1090276.1 hypothetical protein PGTUg99_000745 [Puccinia graminis f. sp. tritici]KAA1119300.1 hypothetical protein PGT21_021446 [Puccinia graminis f. sp. tritici]
MYEGVGKTIASCQRQESSAFTVSERRSRLPDLLWQPDMSNNFSEYVYVSHVHVSQKRKAWNPAVPNPTINQLAAARFRHIGDAFFCSANVTRSSNSAVVMLKLSALMYGLVGRKSLANGPHVDRVHLQS